MKFIFLILFSFSFIVYPNSENYFLEYKDVNDSMQDFSSLKWQAAGLVTIGLITYTNDKKIQDFISNGKDSKFLSDLSKVVIHLGDEKVYYTAGALALGGYVFKNQKLFDTGLLSLSALLLSGTVVTFSKSLIGRSRPRRNMGTYEFDPFFKHFDDNDRKSMFSGDSSNAWALATVISTMNNDKPLIGITLYTLATLVSLNRVFVDAHWPTDVLLGSAVGYYSGKLVTSIFLKNLKKNKRFFFMPIISKSKKDKKLGLNLSYSF